MPRSRSLFLSFNNNININNYSSAMRRLCLSEFRLVAPPVAVHDAHNQSKRQQVATFVANLAVFQQRVSAMLEAARGVSKIAGKYIEFDETCHQSRSYQNVMINFHRMGYGTSTSSWTTSHCQVLTRERVLSKYSAMSYSLVTVEANRHRIAESTK